MHIIGYGRKAREAYPTRGNYLGVIGSARFSNSQVFALQDGVAAPIPFDTTDYNSGGFATLDTPNARIILLSGLYLITSQFQFAQDLDSRGTLELADGTKTESTGAFFLVGGLDQNMSMTLSAALPSTDLPFSAGPPILFSRLQVRAQVDGGGGNVNAGASVLIVRLAAL